MLPKNRRSLYLIEPYKQLRFGIMFISINVIFALLMIIVFGYYLWDIFEAINEYFKLDHSQEMMTASKLAEPLGIFIGLVVLFIISTLYLSARYTHQIYGPLVSIRRYLDDLLEGKNPKPIKLRANDQLHDLVDRLNKLADLSNAGDTSGSLNELIQFTDDLLAGKEPTALGLTEKDPLKSLSLKLNRLAKTVKAQR